MAHRIQLKIVTMTGTDVLTWPTSTECSVRWNFCELNVAQKAFLVGYRSHFNLLRNALVVSVLGARSFRLSPSNDCPQWVNEDRVVIRQANRLHRASKWNWILQGCHGNVRIESLRVELPIRMYFNIHQVSFLRGLFKVAQIVLAGSDVRVLNVVGWRVASLRPETMSG